MDIQNICSAINIYNLNTENKMDKSKDFRELYDKLSGEKTAEEIRTNYDANFNIFKDEESWWQNRHEEFREIIENQKREILEDDYDWWTERMLRHKMFMQIRLTGEIDARLLMDLKNN